MREVHEPPVTWATDDGSQEGTPESLLPSRLEFHVSGSPFAPAYQLSWRAGKLLYEALVADAPAPPDEEHTWELYVPSPEQWRGFWAAVERVGVWNWAPEYLAAHGDGTAWRLEMHHGERGVTCSGHGAYPGSPDSTPSVAFRDFLRALGLLIEGRRLR
jgi:hypothetical protein